MTFAQRSNVKKRQRLLALEDLHRRDLALGKPLAENVRRIGRDVPLMIRQKIQDILVLTDLAGSLGDGSSGIDAEL